jgi:hypothetical protein
VVVVVVVVVVEVVGGGSPAPAHPFHAGPHGVAPASPAVNSTSAAAARI